MRNIHDLLIPHRRNGGHPHLLHPKALLLVGMVGIVVALGIATLTIPTDRMHLGADVYSSVLIDLTNEDRLEKNESQLAKNDQLAYAAQLKADDMADKSYFAHVSPEGLNSWYWFAKSGYVFSYAGENLAVDFKESDAVVRAWMNSPTHRANILNEHFTEIGIAVKEGVYKGKKTIFVAQMFGAPAKSSAAQTFVAVKNITPSVSGSSATSGPVVLGETTVISESANESSTMIVGKNENVEESVSDNKNVTTYTPWYQRILLEFSKPIGIVLTVLGLLLTAALVLAALYHRTLTLRIVCGALIAFIIVCSGYVYLSFAQEVSALKEFR